MRTETAMDRLKEYESCLRSSPALYSAGLAVSRRLPASEMAPCVTAAGRDTGKDQERTRALKKAVGDVCDFVLSPALTAFVLWVLDEAVRSGKKRLYFLARDAYFMYRASEAICRALDLPIECRYLYCSRYSIRLPMYHLDFDNALDQICRGGIGVTLEKILSRAGLSDPQKEEILLYLKENRLVRYAPDAVIPYAELSLVREALEGCDIFREYTMRRSKEELHNLKGFLTQEGLLDDVPMAVVDSGWVGSMQKHLREAAELFKGEKADIEGYYWGLYELPRGVDDSAYHCYYFSPGGNIKEKIYFSNCLFEAVFSAPGGMTLCYREKGGVYEPMFAPAADEHVSFISGIEERFSLYTEVLLEEFQGSRADGGKAAGLSPSERLSGLLACADKDTVSRLLRLFMCEPTIEEAEAFGSLPFSDDVIDYGGHCLAARLTEEELTANHAVRKILSMLGIRKPGLKESAWYEGSAVLGGKNVKRHLKRYAAYKRLLYMRKRL